MVITALALPATIETGAGELTLRRATSADLHALVGLLSDDAIGRSRGDRADPEDLDAYRAGLHEVTEDRANELVVATTSTGEVVGMMQLTRIPGLSRRGATRLQVEAVRVTTSRRSSGIGSAMLRWVQDVAAPATGAALVQLTSDAARADAHRFYERLGFAGSHRGFKYRI